MKCYVRKISKILTDIKVIYDNVDISIYTNRWRPFAWRQLFRYLKLNSILRCSLLLSFLLPYSHYLLRNQLMKITENIPFLENYWKHTICWKLLKTYHFLQTTENIPFVENYWKHTICWKLLKTYHLLKITENIQFVENYWKHTIC